MSLSTDGTKRHGGDAAKIVLEHMARACPKGAEVQFFAGLSRLWPDAALWGRDAILRGLSSR